MVYKYIPDTAEKNSFSMSAILNAQRGVDCPRNLIEPLVTYLPKNVL